MIAMIVEAALRALAVAVLVGAGIWALRVKNVVAQKVAWVMALAAALLMPAVMRWSILPGVQMPLSMAAPWTQAEPVAKSVAVARPVVDAGPSTARVIVVPKRSAGRAAGNDVAVMDVTRQSAAAATGEATTVAATPAKKFDYIFALEGIYFLVLAALLLRLLVGAAAAWRLWMSARRVDAAQLPLLSDGSAARSVRASERVGSPVTIGGGILLPADYGAWPEEKLRVVLAHEESHVRQWDFYLQLAAGAHAALFWFSPLGWWLKGKLTELSETISDGAALRAATDAESYAQVLLEFAAGARPVYAGVAMARKSNLPSRIERLLNDGQLKTAFAEGRVRMYLAGVLVPLAFVAATVHVQGAQQQAVAPDSTQQQKMTVTVQADEAKPEPKTMTVVASGDEPAGAQKRIQVIVKDDEGQGVKEKRGFSYVINDKGESWALIQKGNENDNFVGNFGGESQEQLAKARKMAKGDFFWFTRDGKSYVVDDPETLEQITEAMVPMGKNFEIEMPEIDVPEHIELNLEKMELPSKEELKHDLKDLDETIKKLDLKLGKVETDKELEELQGKLGELQGKLSMMEVKLDANMQVKIQKEVNEQLAKTEVQREKAMKMAEREIKFRTEVKVMDEEKVKAIIEESLKNGKARLVE